MIQPRNTNHNAAAKTNWIAARNKRPCNSCPKPGINKLHNAASTFPPDPWPGITDSSLPNEPNTDDYLWHSIFPIRTPALSHVLYSIASTLSENFFGISFAASPLTYLRTGHSEILRTRVFTILENLDYIPSSNHAIVHKKVPTFLNTHVRRQEHLDLIP